MKSLRWTRHSIVNELHIQDLAFLMPSTLLSSFFSTALLLIYNEMLSMILARSTWQELEVASDYNIQPIVSSYKLHFGDADSRSCPQLFNLARTKFWKSPAGAISQPFNHTSNAKNMQEFSSQCPTIKEIMQAINHFLVRCVHDFMVENQLINRMVCFSKGYLSGPRCIIYIISIHPAVLCQQLHHRLAVATRYQQNLLSGNLHLHHT